MSQRQQEEYLTTLLGIQGWYVARTALRRRKGRSEAVLVLEREVAAYTCGGCGQVYPEARPWRIQELQHLLLWEHVTMHIEPSLQVKRHAGASTGGFAGPRASGVRGAPKVGSGACPKPAESTSYARAPLPGKHNEKRDVWLQNIAAIPPR